LQPEPSQSRGSILLVKEITETVVYGIAAWDLATPDDMKQSKLVIEKRTSFIRI